MFQFNPLAGRPGAALSSLTCPQRVRTNQDTSLIKLIACLTMLIDHFGKMLFPDIPEMRLIGRLAFPLFAYGIAIGAVYTHAPLRYLSRIAALALISQPLYALGLAHENSAMFSVPFFEHPFKAALTFYLNSWQSPSILLSLLLGLTIILCLRNRQWVLALALFIFCSRISSSLDYGLGGIELMLLFYLLCDHPFLSLAATAAFMFSWSRGYGYPFFGHQFGMRIFALPAVLFVHLPLNRRFTLPRWFVYGFYPAHLALLAVLVRIWPA